MKKVMIAVALANAFFAALFGVLYRHIPSIFTLALAITFGMFFYHIAMRLIIGFIINSIYHNRMNYNRKWFATHPAEKRLYKWLRVKKWKNVMPTFSPDTFSMKKQSLEALAQATCQAEVVHEIIIPFNFVPLFLTIPFGGLTVFLITSILGAVFESLFAMIQRYNRPRFLKTIKMVNRRTQIPGAGPFSKNGQ